MPLLQSGLLMVSAGAMVLGVVNLFGVEGFAALAAEALVR
jgi:NADH-quinone oxidoreductase subunit N